MNALDRATLEFVIAKGEAFDQYRAHRLLNGPDTPAPAGWAEDQTPEGGWRSREMKYRGPNMGRTSVVRPKAGPLGGGGVPGGTGRPPPA